MAFDKRALLNDLGAMGADKRLLAEAVEALDKLFDAASRGRFDLTNGTWLNAAEAAGPIGRATGVKVTRIHLVAADASELKEPAFTTEEAVRMINGFRPGETLWWAIWPHNRYAWSTGLEKRLGSRRKQLVAESLMTNLGRGLDTALLATLDRGGKRYFRRFHACLFNNIWDCIQYLVGHALIGDKARVESLMPLVKQLNRFVPFSSKASDPTAWICVTG